VAIGFYLPVENIELLSRYGSGKRDATRQARRVAWQSRKARLKKRIRDMAEALIRIAAARALKTAPVLTPPEGLYDEFRRPLPYEETEDQQTAIDTTLATSLRPADGPAGLRRCRLRQDEVALRAAFVTALAAKHGRGDRADDASARQHFKRFTERFAGLPVRVAQASRLVGAKALAEAKAGIATYGRHHHRHPCAPRQGHQVRRPRASDRDEEQHSRQAQGAAEDLKADVHVLTLSATPIPRTLQLA